MRIFVSLALVIVLAAPRGALANHVTVPDQYATIQSAINALSDGDTVHVRDGDYPEALTLAKPLVLMALDASHFGGPQLGKPCVTSITWSSSPSPRAVRGFRFTAAATFTGTGDLWLDGCWFAGGLSAIAATHGHVWNNVVFGDITATGGEIIDIAMNTVIGGTISYNPPGDSYIHDNVVVGPAAIGVFALSDAYPIRNYVRGCTVGIVSQNEGDGAADNVVEDCSSVGIQVHRYYGANSITNNVVRRCGRGIEIDGQGGSAPVSGNVIEDCTAEGIYARTTIIQGTLANNVVRNSGGRGIDVGASFSAITGNQVLVAGGDGLVATTRYDFPVPVTGNVVSHAAGAGFVLDRGPLVVRGNTSSMNGGAGFALAGTSADSVDHDIGYMNGGVGLAWSGTAPALGCNDWYGNTGGATSGVVMSPTDVVLNPLFCNPAMDDVGLQAASPLASYPGCGRIGALGVTCAYTSASPTPPAALSLDAGPSPSAGAVRFAFVAPGGGATLEVYDVTGQRRFVRALEGERGEFVWRGEGGRGAPLAPGVYFARVVTRDGATLTRRVVLTP